MDFKKEEVKDRKTEVVELLLSKPLKSQISDSKGKPDFSQLSKMCENSSLSKAKQFMPSFKQETDKILNDPQFRNQMQMDINIQEKEYVKNGDGQDDLGEV